MYPEPLLRECGDIDIYFPGHDGISDPLAGITGAARERQPDDSWVYVVDGIIVEHHTDLLDIQSPRAKRYVKRLIEEKGFEKVVTGNGVEVLVPAPEVNLLLLSSHILKHAFGVGIGLRQFCDYAVARRYYEGRVNEEEMREIWKRAGLAKWQELLDAFFVKKTGVLLDIVLKGGNFGVYSKDRENVSRARWARKVQTFRALMGNVGFAFRYAPREWFWTTMQLLGGQFR